LAETFECSQAMQKTVNIATCVQPVSSEPGSKHAGVKKYSLADTCRQFNQFVDERSMIVGGLVSNTLNFIIFQSD